MSKITEAVCPFCQAEVWKYANDREFEENHTKDCIFSSFNPFNQTKKTMDKYKIDYTRVKRLCSLLTEEPLTANKLWKNEDLQYIIAKGDYIWEKFINWDRITIVNEHNETEPSALWRINPRWKQNLQNFTDEPVTKEQINAKIRWQANLE